MLPLVKLGPNVPRIFSSCPTKESGIDMLRSPSVSENLLLAEKM
jgi:hypothetical protein